VQLVALGEGSVNLFQPETREPIYSSNSIFQIYESFWMVDPRETSQLDSIAASFFSLQHINNSCIYVTTVTTVTTTDACHHCHHWIIGTTVSTVTTSTVITMVANFTWALVVKKRVRTFLPHPCYCGQISTSCPTQGTYYRLGGGATLPHLLTFSLIRSGHCTTQTSTHMQQFATPIVGWFIVAFGEQNGVPNYAQ
jgi:hypothetical protein